MCDEHSETRFQHAIQGVVWTVGALVWAILTLVTVAVAIESGSGILWACSAAFMGLGAFVLLRSKREPGPLWGVAITWLWRSYCLLCVGFWIVRGLIQYFQKH